MKICQNTFKTTPDGAIAVLKEDKLHQWMRSVNIEIPMMGLLDNYDGINWRVKEMADMLASPAARKNLQQALVELRDQVTRVGNRGGFRRGAERFTVGSSRNLWRNCRGVLHAANLKLMVALPARDEEYDYGFFGKNSAMRLC